MKTVEQMVEHYKSMRANVNATTMYNEAKWQYISMANGGDGGCLGFEQNGQTTCRGINYPNHPDSFFRQVCEHMGWLG